MADRPKDVPDAIGRLYKDREEPLNNPITWVFEEGTFRPAAKLTEKGAYSIITDYLGTPVEMYNKYGEKTWETRLDIYGKVASFEGGKYESSSISDCPFRYQGQYEDSETGLYYNRFRYYSPDEGMYISQDPIGLAGGNPTLYGYVHNPNSWVDVFGLDIIRLRHYTSNKGFSGIKESMVIKAGDQNAVFATRAKGNPLSMTDASDKFKIERHHARNYIDFDIDSSRVELRVNDLGVEEYKIKGDVVLDPKTTKFVKRC